MEGINEGCGLDDDLPLYVDVRRTTKATICFPDVVKTKSMLEASLEELEECSEDDDDGETVFTSYEGQTNRYEDLSTNFDFEIPAGQGGSRKRVKWTGRDKWYDPLSL